MYNIVKLQVFFFLFVWYVLWGFCVVLVSWLVFLFVWVFRFVLFFNPEVAGTAADRAAHLQFALHTTQALPVLPLF